MRALVIIAISVFGVAMAKAQDCRMDQYKEWTVDSIADPTIRSEVLSLYPQGLLDDTSHAVLIVVPGRTNCQDRATFKSNGVVVTIEGAAFDTSAHTFSYDTSQKVPFLCGVDGRGIWGTDGGMPREEIRSLSVMINGKRTVVPTYAYKNLFEPNFCDTYPRSADQPISVHARCSLSEDGKRLYIHMMNSDGAGGYLVTWIFVDGRYWGRVVEHGF